MPIMTVTTTYGKTQIEKEKLAMELTDCIQNLLERPREIIRVIFNEVPCNSYSVGGVFLNTENGDDDTILRIAIMAGRNSEDKKKIIESLKGVLDNNKAFSKGAYRIIVEENGKDNFFRSR